MNAINTTASNTTVPTIPERQCRTCPKMFVPAESRFKNCPECHYEWLLKEYGEPCEGCEKMHVRNPRHQGEFSRCKECIKLDAKQRADARKLQHELDMIAWRQIDETSKSLKKVLKDPHANDKSIYHNFCLPKTREVKMKKAKSKK
jgi:hypothetical protein